MPIPKYFCLHRSAASEYKYPPELLCCFLAPSSSILSGASTTRSVDMTTTTFSSAIAAVLLASALLVASSVFWPTASGGATACGPKDVFVSQSNGEPQRDGTSEYRVDVVNRCGGGDFDGDGKCVVSDIHLFCGHFRSVLPVDPELLRVVGPADCLLINGNAILPTSNVSFVYTSYVEYQMSVISATCVA